MNSVSEGLRLRRLKDIDFEIRLTKLSKCAMKEETKLRQMDIKS